LWERVAKLSARGLLSPALSHEGRGGALYSGGSLILEIVA
jgi:hypothetical protein